MTRFCEPRHISRSGPESTPSGSAWGRHGSCLAELSGHSLACRRPGKGTSRKQNLAPELVQIASEPSLADPGTQGGPRLSGVEEPKGRLNRLRGVSPAKRDGAPCKAPVCGDAIQSASMDRPTRFGEEGVGQRDLARFRFSTEKSQDR